MDEPRSDPCISEYRPEAEAGPNQDVELKGAAFSGVLTYINSNGGAGNNKGQVTSYAPVSGVFDPNGLKVVSIPVIQEPGGTFVFSQTFTGDTNTNVYIGGTFDDSAFGTVYDAIGFKDNNGDKIFGAAFLAAGAKKGAQQGG